jgi:hypothetical protein
MPSAGWVDINEDKGKCTTAKWCSKTIITNGTIEPFSMFMSSFICWQYFSMSSGGMVVQMSGTLYDCVRYVDTARICNEIGNACETRDRFGFTSGQVHIMSTLYLFSVQMIVCCCDTQSCNVDTSGVELNTAYTNSIRMCKWNNMLVPLSTLFLLHLYTCS